MDVTKTVVGVVGLVVCMLMVAYAAIPMIEEAGYEKEYESNTKLDFRYNVADSLTVSYDGSVLTFDGETATVPANTIAAFSDTVRLVYSNSNYYLRYYAQDVNTQIVMAAGDTLTMEKGRFVFDPATGDDVTGVYNRTVLYFDAQGDYTSLRDADDGNSLLYRSNLPMFATTGTSQFLSFAKIFNVASGEGNMTVLSTGSKITVPMTWDATVDDQGVTTITASPTMTVDDAVHHPAIFVPVDYYILVEGDGTTATLFSVVGTLLIIGLVMMAVRLFTGRD